MTISRRQRELLERLATDTTDYLTCVLDSLPAEMRPHFANVITQGAVGVALTIRTDPFKVDRLLCPKNGQDPMILQSSLLETEPGEPAGARSKVVD